MSKIPVQVPAKYLRGKDTIEVFNLGMQILYVAEGNKEDDEPAEGGLEIEKPKNWLERQLQAIKEKWALISIGKYVIPAWDNVKHVKEEIKDPEIVMLVADYCREYLDMVDEGLEAWVKDVVETTLKLISLIQRYPK